MYSPSVVLKSQWCAIIVSMMFQQWCKYDNVASTMQERLGNNGLLSNKKWLNDVVVNFD